MAGSYVWNLKDNGYRKSYGIVTAMFGITIVGCWAFRAILADLNKKLEEGERAWETQPDEARVSDANAPDEALGLHKGYRYIL